MKNFREGVWDPKDWDVVEKEDKWLLTLHYRDFKKSVTFVIDKYKYKPSATGKSNISYIYFTCYDWINNDGGYIVYRDEEPHILSTENIEEATPLIHGRVKFDGTMHFYIGFEDDGYHDISGMKDLKNFTGILEEVFRQAKEFMTNPMHEKWDC